MNLFNDSDVLDEEGSEYPNMSAAKEAAIAGGRELIAAHVRNGLPVNLDHRIEIADASGKTLSVIAFREIVTILGR